MLLEFFQCTSRSLITVPFSITKESGEKGQNANLVIEDNQGEIVYGFIYAGF